MVSEISILIPVYNQPVLSLVESLLQQAACLSIPFEIRVYDDGSSAEFLKQNKPLANIHGVVYRVLSENVGRSKIRFLLAQEATFNWLLFLDNDILPQKPAFLQKYISETKADVAVGGVAYQTTYPAGTRLRWLYGKNREEAPAQERQKNPYQRLFLSNLFIRKDIMLNAFSGIEINGYGHEDTLFAHRLQQEKIPIQHLNNPVYHLGLEDAPVFLAKTEQALQNLAKLLRDYDFADNSKLLKAVGLLQRTKVDGIVRKCSPALIPLLKQNLESQSPNLLLFDLYKLLLFLRHKG